MPKFDTQDPARISALDYNAIQSKISSILGTGSGTRGYGQTVSSAPVLAGNIITTAQWQNVRYDLLNIKLHQDGVLPQAAEVRRGDVIGFGAGYPNTNFDSLAESALLNRFNVGTGQSVITNKATASTSSAWSSRAQATLTINFGTADQGRYFFNSGGEIRISANRTGGSATQQNNAWTNLLSQVGIQRFSGAFPTLTNYYSLTNSYQTYFYLPYSTPYSANYVRLEALCNVPTNVNGTATSMTIRITLADDYVDGGDPAPGDSVDGTVSITVDELKASGILQPAGTFTVTSPTYSLSSIGIS